jgi:hypothetical protein
MKRLSVLILIAALGRSGLLGATTPLYINSSPVLFPLVPPQIDATAFVNQSIFDVDATGPFGGGDLPYQILNNLYFTNQGSGDMFAYPGFRFDYLHNGFRSPMDTWINKGTIEAAASPFGFFGSSASWLLVGATNITNRGSLRVDPTGLMRLEGKNVSISHSDLSARSPSVAGSLIPFAWGVGTNGVFGSGTNSPTQLDSLRFPMTPRFQVSDGFFIFNAFLGFGSNYATFVWTNTPGSNTTFINIAFVRTNSFETNLTVQASLITNRAPPGSATMKVDLSFVGFDPFTEITSTNGVSITDSLTFTNSLQLIFPTNFSPNRPNVLNITGYTVTTNGQPANGVYSPNLIYDSENYLTNQANIPYAAYFVFFPAVGGGSFSGSDPTNFTGRVEVLGDNVNLDQAFVQAESTVIIKAKNLSSNKVARTLAPFEVLDLASTQPTFTVSNLISSDITRLSGDVEAWGGFWTNYVVIDDETNTLVFNVLVVDQFLQTHLPVVTSQLALSATNLVINDLVNLGTYAPNTPAYSNYYNAFFSYVAGTRMFLNCESLTINNGFSLPPGWGWGSSNVQGLLHFTNAGFLFVPNGAAFGSDRPQPYDDIVNSGTILAGSVSANVSRLENRGAIGTDEGPITFDSQDAILSGIPVTSFNYNYVSNRPAYPPSRPFFTNVGCELRAGGDLSITANALILSNAVLLSGASYVTNFGLAANNGVFSLAVTDTLTDSGTNYIWNHGGVEAATRPANSDLLNTTLIITADRSEEIFNVWAGEDRGTNSSGYVNNLALGKLVCNFDRNSLVYFTPTTLNDGFYATNAMYVDYLQLQNYATNFDSFAISESFTIYFANANLSPALIESASGGRMRWVPSFAGPLSSTTYTAANGKVYQVNAALARSMTIDSDGDGIVNGLDPKPFYTPDDAVLSVSLTSETPKCAQLSWTAPANATNTVEYRAAPGTGEWNVLTNFVQGALNTPTTILDPLSTTGVLRVYRLRVSPKSN